ncbi:hypothetical protein STXM2123_582 [Streptomyces sp. F-3]|nr:hypothetical protein STXM2123_582 [Streptomyces sp. F-3]
MRVPGGGRGEHGKSGGASQRGAAPRRTGRGTGTGTGTRPASSLAGGDEPVPRPTSPLPVRRASPPE